jgi:dipeptidase E
VGKLFFYSDQVVESSGNRRLDEKLLAGMNTENVKVGYIPCTEDKEKNFFRTKTDYYQSYGIQDILFFDLYSEFNPLLIEDLLNCDIIHLSAGNPIEFRKAIKQRNMEKVLFDYFNNGGTIVGVSGGAVQLGRTTTLFQLFIGDKDENLEALQLVDFEFSPHYNRWNEDYKRDVLDYVKTTGTTVYAGNDGDGIIVDNDKIEMIGDIFVISEHI